MKLYEFSETRVRCWTTNSSQNVRTSFLQAAFSFMDYSSGVSICQMYVIQPDDLRFKLEAFNYKATATLSEIMPITMVTLSAFKTQMQQSLSKANTSRAQPKSRNLVAASVNRSRIPAHMVPPNRSNPSVQTSGPVKQEQFLTTSIASSSSISKTSNVTFVGPSMSPQAVKKRACELFLRYI